MTQTTTCRVASGPHLGGFPVLVEFVPVFAERDLGDERDGVEIKSILTQDGVAVGRWFWNALSDDQWLDLLEQCAANA
jgi:hypothetical protein